MGATGIVGGVVDGASLDPEGESSFELRSQTYLTKTKLLPAERLQTRSRQESRSTDRPSLAATTIIAPRLSEYFREAGDSESCRTCRLVCQDWARQSPLTYSAFRAFKIDDDGAVLHHIENNWERLPTELWAWTIVSNFSDWWVDRSRCKWIPKV